MRASSSSAEMASARISCSLSSENDFTRAPLLTDSPDDGDCSPWPGRERNLSRDARKRQRTRFFWRSPQTPHRLGGKAPQLSRAFGQNAAKESPCGAQRRNLGDE